MSLTINNDLKLSGLASGLDTESIVEGLLSTYQSKVGRQNQKTTELEWKAEAYREVNSLIKAFREEYLSVLSDSNMMTASAYNIFDVTMLDTTSAVSISAGSSAIECAMTIDSVTQLATAATIKSTGVFTGEKYSSDATLEELELENMLEFDENDEISFSINGITFTFAKNSTVGEMFSEINASDAGVTMRFSSLTEGFKITSDSTGSESTVEIVNISGNAFSATDSAFGIAEGTYTGQDAILSIEGIEVIRSSNTFTIDGITYTLQDESDTSISFTISQDINSTVEKVVSFVETYNELVAKLESLLDEKVYRDYDPLTDAQKEEMTEKEIELWEGYAKSGLLHNDSYIFSLLSSLRSAFYTTVEGTGLSLFDIGLTTTSYATDGQITVDEDALRAALEDDPETVLALFVQDSDDFSGSGLIVRISDSLLSYTESVTDIALDSLEEKISDSEDREEKLEDRMKEKEEALWAKFTAMETALASLNSLSSWLETLFSS
ncbi:MAG: flagellar filament capping protein FliD [Eubacteriales bacterium]|nr:flagellar filament capping protein FliD [Eubacteriales bacterium]